MSDLSTRRAQFLTPLSSALGRMGFGPAVLIGVGFAAGLAAAVAVVLHVYLAGLFLFVLGEFGFVLAYQEAAVSRRLSILRDTLGAIVLAGIPFAFALADARHALSASFAMLGLLVERAAVSGAMREDDAMNSAPMPVEAYAFVVSILFALACLMPDWFGVMAYAAGLVSFVTAGFALGALVGDRSP